MIGFVLRYVNKLVQLSLIVLIVLLLIVGLRKDREYSVGRSIDIVDATYSYGDNVSEVELVESSSDVKSISVYDETKEWSLKFPEDDLPDVSGVNKDAYGNYIITEEMFSNPDSLPFNEEGYIDYVYYYDNNGNVLNPLPSLYNEYLDYYGLNGG